MAREPRAGEVREGVTLTNLDQPLFAEAGASKRELVDYLDAVSGRILPELRDRPLSVIRVTGGQRPFMQKHVPDTAPEWIARLPLWAETSQRMVAYALCNDRHTLLWFANQRAVEYHPALVRCDHLDQATHLVLDIDPPPDAPFATATHAALVVRDALAGAGLRGAVKTSGAKGVHVMVPVGPDVSLEDAALATRAIAARAERLDPSATTTAFIKSDRHGKVFLDATRTGGATVIAAYSPRARAGVPVSFPVGWEQLEQVTPQDFTILTVPEIIGERDPWAEALPPPQSLPADLIEEGRGIPIPRVAAMHEGRRRAAARRAGPADH